MAFDTQEKLDSLIKSLAEQNQVHSIGMSGSKSPLPTAGEGDIDLFIYCDSIPGSDEREAAIKRVGQSFGDVSIGVFQGGHWGTGDLVHINGIETWLMYFTIAEALQELEYILEGRYPDKLDNYYYPIGRCAMLSGICILSDRSGFLDSLKNRLHEYPDSLAGILIQYHLEELKDTEDLERAVTRKDIMFFHFALDIALDHYLQALFALNRTYFPSRKRSLEIVAGFNLQPEDCGARMLRVIRLGSSAEGISKAYELWSCLVSELDMLCRVILE